MPKDVKDGGIVMMMMLRWHTSDDSWYTTLAYIHTRDWDKDASFITLKLPHNKLLYTS